jgi:hypothetical protein
MAKKTLTTCSGGCVGDDGKAGLAANHEPLPLTGTEIETEEIKTNENAEEEEDNVLPSPGIIERR